MMRFLRPRHFIVALGLLAGLLGTAAPAQAQIIATVTGEADQEGNTITFNIHLDNDSDAATLADADEIRFVTSDGTAVVGGIATNGGDDYEALDTGFTLDIPALAANNVGLTDEADLQVVVTTNEDNTFEPDETFTGTISNVAGGLDVAAGDFSDTATILNDDLRPTISIADSPTASEDQTNRIFEVTLSNPTFETVTVNYVTQDGTAKSGGPNPDYVAEGGQLTFNPFVTSVFVIVSVIDDAINEPSETFFVNLFDASLATVNTGTVPGDPDGITDANASATITDNDPDPSFSVFPSTQDVCETDPPIHFTVTLSAPSEVPAVFDIDVTGSATFGVDYELRVDGVLYNAPGDNITFAPGQTVKIITLVPLDDLDEDPSETFELTLDDISGIDSADLLITGTILDDESLSVTIEQIPNSDGILDFDPEIDITTEPEICFRVTVTNECGDEVAGEEVEIVINGNTGSDQVIFLTTDGEGEAEFCYTPLFPGGDDIDVFIDGEFFTSIFVDVDLAPGTDSRVEGSGYVDGTLTSRGGIDVQGEPGSGVVGVPAYFSLNASRKRNGKLQGSVNVESLFGNQALKFRSSRITAMIAGDASPSGGHAAILFGTGKLTVQQGRNKSTHVVAFRVDALDNGTPGVPNDRFVLTLLDDSFVGPGKEGVGFDLVSTLGGALKHARGKGVKNEVIIDTPGLPIGGGPIER